MTVTVVTNLEEFHAIIASDVPAVFDFWATWCGPCKVISPIYEKLAENFPENQLRFYKVDVDQAEDISQEVGIRAMPTFAAFKNGTKIGELVGANPQGLQAMLEKVKVSDSA